MTELVFLAVVLVGGYYGWKHRAAIWKWLNDMTNPVPPQ
jgi:NADH:ubiquinone oxidoreductase subunit 3 (subunit A)